MATTTGLAESTRWTLLCGTPNTRLNARQNAASESHAFVLHYGVSEDLSCGIGSRLRGSQLPVCPSTARSEALLHSENAVSQASTSV